MNRDDVINGEEVLLTRLETRWHSLVDTVQTLRMDNGTLRQTLGDAADLSQRMKSAQEVIASLEQEVSQLRQQVRRLEEEKLQTIERVEEILSRIDTR
ncbi:MAG: cell division protein ZapB [Magnetococcales bacterium]|nr:cell division protein ZapB [Magnetococcales bacterium]